MKEYCAADIKIKIMFTHCAVCIEQTELFKKINNRFLDPGSLARKLTHGLDLVQQKRGLSLSEGAGLDFVVVTVKKNESYRRTSEAMLS